MPFPAHLAENACGTSEGNGGAGGNYWHDSYRLMKWIKAKNYCAIL